MKKFPAYSFQSRYLYAALILFFAEILIALYVHDNIIRPYIGDLLVVIFLYCLLRSFLDIPVYTLAVCVLAFAFIIETFQYFKLINHLGLGHSRLAHIILGTSFSWTDLFCYTLGTLLVIVGERLLTLKQAIKR